MATALFSLPASANLAQLQPSPLASDGLAPLDIRPMPDQVPVSAPAVNLGNDSPVPQLGEAALPITHRADSLLPLVPRQNFQGDRQPQPPRGEIEPGSGQAPDFPESQPIAWSKVATQPENFRPLTLSQEGMAAPVPNAPTSQVVSQTGDERELGTLQLKPLPQPAASDPELGTLRLRPLAQQPGQDPELGTLRLQPRDLQTANSDDPELGRLRLRLAQPPAPPRPPVAYLVGRLDYFRTTNVFSGLDPVDDGLFRTGVTLFYAPPLGPQTFLVTSIEGNLIRYTTLSPIDYNELHFRAGILQQLSPSMFGGIGWNNQQLYTASEGLKNLFHGRRFFNENSLRLELSRQDQLSPRLSLSTYYQLRFGFADPADRSRIINSMIASLNYSFSRQFQAAIDYQFALTNFTEQPRQDAYHQLVGRLTYSLNSNSQLYGFGGFSFGHSSEKTIDFNSVIFGVGLVVSLPLF